MGGTAKLICSGIAGMFGIALLAIGGLTVVFFDEFVDKIIYSRLVIEDGSEMMEMFKNPPVKPVLNVYFFNVTNTLEFLRGDKPILEEVGPYVYRQNWVKTNFSLNGNGTVSSALKKTYHFDRESSIGAESDMVTIIDVPTVTAIWQVRYTPRFVQLIFSSMLEVLEKGPFTRRNVSDLLWGYEDPLIKMAKDIMPPESRPPTDYFGFFYGTNGTAKTLLTQYAGSIDDMSMYMDVQRANGRDHMDFWLTEECNRIRGSDGSAFHPHINRTDTLYLYNDALCRVLPLVYQKDIESYGIKGYRFAPPDDVFAHPAVNPDNLCYCVGGPPCTGGGVFNISSCKFGSPTLLSWPHFFKADKFYRNEVKGMKPDKDKHEFNIEVIPRTGLPLKATARVQVNMMLTNVSEIKPARGLRPIVFPVIWFQDGVPEMPEATIAQLRLSANLPETLKITTISVSFVLGCMLLVAAVILAISLLYCEKSEDITKDGNRNQQMHPQMLRGHVNPALDNTSEKD